MLQGEKIVLREFRRDDKEEGRIRDQRYYNGRYWDEIIMGIIKEEYLAQGRKTGSSHE